MGFVYKDRMRTADDKLQVLQLYSQIFHVSKPQTIEELCDSRKEPVMEKNVNCNDMNTSENVKMIGKKNVKGDDIVLSELTNKVFHWSLAPVYLPERTCVESPERSTPEPDSSTSPVKGDDVKKTDMGKLPTKTLLTEGSEKESSNEASENDQSRKKSSPKTSVTYRPYSMPYSPSRVLRVTSTHVQAGGAFLKRSTQVGGSIGEKERSTMVLHHCLEPLESLMTCINMGWMAILVSC